MSDNVLTVKQEVASILRLTLANYNASAEAVLAAVEDPQIEAFHADVRAELDKIVDGYLNPPAAAVEAPRGFKIGDKVVITGSDFVREDHGVQAGDVVEITDPGDADWGSREMRFKDPKHAWRTWYIYSENIPSADGGSDDEFDLWGGRLLTEEEQEIKVGDTVRILPIYGEVIGASKGYVGQEFVVTEVVNSLFEHGRIFSGPDSGLTSRFYVRGDAEGRGIWEAFIEKVYK